MKRLEVGDAAPPIDVTTLRSGRVKVPAHDGRLLHLQFRRFAGCPICNLHLRTLARRVGELDRAGVHEVAFFHSEAATMQPYQGDLPFEVVADPERRVYDAYGVGSSARSVLDPRAWRALAAGMLAPHRSNAVVGEGGHMGLPADFLLSDTGAVLAARYGVHADDQWSVDEILALAASARSGSLAHPSHSTR